MNGLDRIKLKLREFLMRFSEGSLSMRGIWDQLTTTQVATVVAVHVTFIVVLALEGREFFIRYLSLIVLGYLVVMLPATLLAWRVEKVSAGNPSGLTLAWWTLAAVVLGIPAMHSTLDALTRDASLIEKYVALPYLPEFSVVLIIGLVYWRHMSDRQWKLRLDAEKHKREAAENNQALTQAQLRVLRAQIEPHFLYNTLASVQHLVRNDHKLADFLLSQLIVYLREAVPDIRGMGSTLGREFGLIEAFLNIAKVRMGGRLEVEVSMPQELNVIPFPSMVIQTLVENTLKHGVEPKQGPVKISVTASEVEEGSHTFIEITVLDNGVGFGVGKVLGTGIGLANVRERLAGLYDSGARLTITDASPTGVKATVRIPK